METETTAVEPTDALTAESAATVATPQSEETLNHPTAVSDAFPDAYAQMPDGYTEIMANAAVNRLRATTYPTPVVAALLATTAGRQLVTIAAVCHEATRTHRQQGNDFTFNLWEFAAESQHLRALRGVLVNLKYPQAPDSEAHDWTRGQQETGWQYGQQEDALAKTSPDLTRYSELSREQQTDYRLIKAITLAYWQSLTETEIQDMITVGEQFLPAPATPGSLTQKALSAG